MLHLSIGLPLRNGAAAQALVAAITNPASHSYRHYLTPVQFEREFSPSVRDYQALIAFARASGFAVTHIFSHRIVLSVVAPASAVERAFHLTLLRRLRPDGSVFYAPSNEPALALSTPILHIAGLDNEFVPKPRTSSFARRSSASGSFLRKPHFGSGPGGTFAGQDFRMAYALNVAQTGMGQCIGIAAFDGGFFPADIASYEKEFNLPKLAPTGVPIDGFSGPSLGDDEELNAANIEVALAMAPNLSHIFVYEGPSFTASDLDDTLAAMASPAFSGGKLCNQLSSMALGGEGGDADKTSRELTDAMAMQGQSLFIGSVGGGQSVWPEDAQESLSNATAVGETVLTLNADHRWLSETGWTDSGGGFVTSESTPPFQLGMFLGGDRHMPLTSRAIPDVAIVSNNVFVIADNGAYQGPGINGLPEIPLPSIWAGEAALINEAATAIDAPLLGFPNPPLYTVANNAKLYAANFRDITTGSNGMFNALPGYDLVTGWGTPTAKLVSTLNPSPAKNFTQLQIVIFTGSDDLRSNSDLQVSFSGIANLPPFCLMHSDFGPPSGVCTGSVAGDVNGTKGWGRWSTRTLTYTNRFANWKWSGSGTMTLTLNNHNNVQENNDNWDLQAMSVTLSNPVTKTSVTLFNVGNFNAPHHQGNCYWRFKPSGSPPLVSQTFNLLPATTPSNGCPDD